MVDIKRAISTIRTINNNKEAYKQLLRRLPYDDVDEIIAALDNLDYNLDKRKFFGLKFQQDFRCWIPIDIEKEIDICINKNFDCPEDRAYYKERLLDTYKNIKFFVVSYNPVDFLMCSYGDGYASCLSLNSEYNNCWGVPPLFSDNARYMVFLSKGKHKNKLVNDISFRRPDKKIRSWALKGSKSGMILKPYGLNTTTKSEILFLCIARRVLDKNFIFYNSPFKEWQKFESIKTNVIIPTINGAKCFVYEDSTYLNLETMVYANSNNCHVYENDWSGISTVKGGITITRWLEGGIDKSRIENSVKKYTCDHCGESHCRVYSTNTNGYICGECADNYYQKCAGCCTFHPDGQLQRLLSWSSTYLLCNTCISRRPDITTCHDCGEKIITYSHGRFNPCPDGNTRCRSCTLNTYKECRRCSDLIPQTETYCENCTEVIDLASRMQATEHSRPNLIYFDDAASIYNAGNHSYEF